MDTLRAELEKPMLEAVASTVWKSQRTVAVVRAAEQRVHNEHGYKSFWTQELSARAKKTWTTWKHEPRWAPWSAKN